MAGVNRLKKEINMTTIECNYCHQLIRGVSLSQALAWFNKHKCSKSLVKDKKRLTNQFSGREYRCHVCGVLEGEKHKSICSVGNGIYRR